MSTRRTSTDSLRQNPNAYADAALDGDLSLDALFATPGAKKSDAAHVQVIRRLERLLRIEKNASQTPDLSAVILADVGARRGWLAAPSRRLVWGGRLIAAATLLIALGATLSVRRAMPELAGQSPGSAALASMVDAGEQAGATVPLVGMVEVIGQRRPVLAQLTATLEFDSVTKPKSTSLALCSQETRVSQRSGVVVVRVSLDPASQRTVDAVAGLSGSPKWVRSACAGGLSPDRK